MNRQETIAAYERLFVKVGADDDLRRECERQLAQTDLFYLLVYVLSRNDVNHDWIFGRCREVEAAPNGYLDLWARDHFKSSLITYGMTIKDILCDPEITVGIFSFSRPIAKAFLRQIKHDFEVNEKLRTLFPEICWDNPARDAPKWSEDDGIIVRRKSNPKESTVEAWGLVDSTPVSKHYRLMIYDDVVTGDSVSTPEMIQKVTVAWERSLALRSENAGVRYIGTRWHRGDTYKTILDRGAAIERRHPCTVDGATGGEPVRYTREQLARIRAEMGPYTWAAQMMLDPASERDMAFDISWLKHYDPAEATDTDPAE